MQQQNLEIIQRDWVDALREGDTERAIARLAPEIAWQGVESHLLCRNREDVERWLRGFIEGGQPRIERLELTPVTGGVVLSVAGPNVREAGDAPLGGELHILFRLRDGQISNRHARLPPTRGGPGRRRFPPPPVPPREVVADLGPPAPERARAVGLVPFAYVADVARSAGFYRLLGFEAPATYAPSVRLEWALSTRRAA